MGKKQTAQFWELAHNFLDHHLKNIRQVSPHTVNSYRDCLNRYIDYLEEVEKVDRRKITFEHFNKEILKRYQDWMIAEKQLAPKTCNLRLTAIRSFLEFSAQEHLWLMPIYTEACTIKATLVQNHPIEYFEPQEMSALLACPNIDRKVDRRNRMILIFLYDTAIRVSEARALKVEDLHLKAQTPYVTILGKGRKYRNLPLMEKTLDHLEVYLKEFHGGGDCKQDPLFYSNLNGQKSPLSSDTFEKMIKKYARQCQENGQAMPQNVHCHMIRKTRAMDLYRNGVPLTHIQQLLGHKNISTTSGFYAFATLETLAQALETVKEDNEVKLWKDSATLDQLYKL